MTDCYHCGRPARVCKKATRKKATRKKKAVKKAPKLPDVVHADDEDGALGMIDVRLNRITKDSRTRTNTLLNILDDIIQRFEESTEAIRNELSESYDGLESLRRDTEGDIDVLRDRVDGRRAKLASEKVA